MTITIPPAALEAGARAIENRINQPGQCSYHDMARAAFLAMIEAWPGMKREPTDWERWMLDFPFLILPLTQEKTDGNYDYAGGL